MPKSKRNKVVHLTQVKKKGKDHKEDLVKQLEEYVKQYEFVYLLDFDKTKSDRIMNLRVKMKDQGRIFAGRNSLVSQAMKTIGSKTNTSYGKFLKHVVGHRGLLFTNIARDEMISMLEDGQQEFRDKLLGYAHLKAPDDDTVDQDEQEDEDGDDEDDDENGDDATSDDGKTKKKCVSFKPIKKSKKKKKQQQKKGTP